jgi:hypothetical protein
MVPALTCGRAFADFPPGLAKPTQTSNETLLGCVISEHQFQGFAQSFDRSNHYGRDSETLIPRSNDRVFDRALAETLSMLVDAFNVLPGFSYYDDSDAENACATPSKLVGNDRNGTVLFGLSFLAELRSLNESPEIAVACVCAHEFGHIVQFERNIHDRILEGEPTVKRVELHADYMAGYFAGLRKLQRPTFPADVFAATQYKFGDNHFTSQQHHGTHEERGAAVVRGFHASHDQQLSLSDAIQDGMNYVSNL